MVDNSNTRHVLTLEVARGRENSGKLRPSAHHEGVELVAIGVTEIGRIEMLAALSGRALAGTAERQRELVDAIDLSLILGSKCGHHAVADRHRLAVRGKGDAKACPFARTTPGDEAIVRHEAAHAEFAADLVVEFAGLLEVVRPDRDIADHKILPLYLPVVSLGF